MHILVIFLGSWQTTSGEGMGDVQTTLLELLGSAFNLAKFHRKQRIQPYV